MGYGWTAFSVCLSSFSHLLLLIPCDGGSGIHRLVKPRPLTHTSPRPSPRATSHCKSILPPRPRHTQEMGSTPPKTPTSSSNTAEAPSSPPLSRRRSCLCWRCRQSPSSPPVCPLSDGLDRFGQSGDNASTYSVVSPLHLSSSSSTAALSCTYIDASQMPS